MEFYYRKIAEIIVRDEPDPVLRAAAFRVLETGRGADIESEGVIAGDLNSGCCDGVTPSFPAPARDHQEHQQNGATLLSAGAAGT